MTGASHINSTDVSNSNLFVRVLYRLRELFNRDKGIVLLGIFLLSIVRLICIAILLLLRT